jgi:hypothetical protein
MTRRERIAFLLVLLYPVRPRRVDDAIGWLDEHWNGGVFVPNELLPLVAVA